MKRKVFIVINSDPRTSHRPVEALRVALGLRESDIDVRIICPDELRIYLQPDSAVDGELLPNIRENLPEDCISARADTTGGIRLLF
jgi:hypothetical protein